MNHQDAANRPLPGKRRRFGERGQAMVELAFVLPIFLVIVLATIDFGWALRNYITATNSAREGARLGVTGATADQIKTRTTSFSNGLLKSSDVTVTGAKGSAGSSVKVAVNYNYTYITPLGGMLSVLSGGTFPQTLAMKTSTTMRIE